MLKHDSLKRIRRQQTGLTLVELMIAIALTGIVTAAITMVISDVFFASARTSNHMTAVRQVQAAEYWLSRDVRQAFPEHIDDSTGGQLLGLQWFEFDEVAKVWRTVIVEYILDEAGNLRRLEYMKPNSESDPVLVAHTVVAQYIDPAETSFLRSNGALVFTVTATVGGQSETRIYEIMPRPGS